MVKTGTTNLGTPPISGTTVRDQETSCSSQTATQRTTTSKNCQQETHESSGTQGVSICLTQPSGRRHRCHQGANRKEQTNTTTLTPNNNNRKKNRSHRSSSPSRTNSMCGRNRWSTRTTS